jgi:hypothetical protein
VNIVRDWASEFERNNFQPLSAAAAAAGGHAVWARAASPLAIKGALIATNAKRPERPAPRRLVEKKGCDDFSAGGPTIGIGFLGWSRPCSADVQRGAANIRGLTICHG